MAKEPRIILYDIETIPNLQAALENWVDLVPPFPGKKPTMSASVSTICSFGYRVFGEKNAVGVNAWDFPEWEKDVNDDSAICKRALEVFKDADAVVTFNGKRFDEKFIQTRLGIHGLDFMCKVPHIDLCKVTAANMFLLNNRLKTVAKFLLNDKKLDHDGWPLWVKTHGGVNRVRDVRAEALMSKYNLKDVNLMVPLFKRLRPLIKNIPNHNAFTEAGSKNVCPACGSTRLVSNGIRATQLRIYRRLNCKDCGFPMRVDVNDKNPRAL